ncbi:MAG: leucine-rich repeat protein, partial [Clostridia bacterium]|nr:leucine-rich repeat protein [Clostridia bacterium]
MKKKLLLLTVLVIALSCLFAIGVSAADEVTVIVDGGTDTVDFEEVFNLKDGYVAGFKDSATYGKHNVQDVIFPATIVGFNSSSKSLFKESTVIKSITFKGTSVDMYNSESMFQSSSIQSVIFEQGHDCILNAHDYTKNVFSGCTSLTTIKFPTITKLKSDGTSDTGDALSGMFYNCTKMVAQNDIVFGEGVVSLGGQMMFENCSSLSNNAEQKCDVYFPSTIVTINHRSFRN